MSTALRLYPSVPINVRTAAYPTVIPRGGGPEGLSPVLVRRGQGVGFIGGKTCMERTLASSGLRGGKMEHSKKR